MKQDEINAVKKAAEKMRKQKSAQDEIIEMAREAGFMMENSAAIQAAEIFANLATAKEREACAKVAEPSFGVIGSTIALAIRARGEQA
jgi:hypothetical protein